MLHPQKESTLCAREKCAPVFLGKHMSQGAYVWGDVSLISLDALIVVSSFP